MRSRLSSLHDRRRKDSLEAVHGIWCFFSGFLFPNFLLPDANLDLLQLRVPLDKLLRSPAGETHAHPPVILIAFHTDHGPNSILRVSDLCPEHRVCLYSTLDRRPPK